MWYEVMLGLTQMMGYNVYIPLLIMQMNDSEENLYLQFLMSLVRPSFPANYSMHEMDTHQMPNRVRHINFVYIMHVAASISKTYSRVILIGSRV